MEPLIINAAITGMVPMRQDSPHVPIRPKEIIADARRCRDAGASILHVHVREDDGTPGYRKEAYAEIIAGIREIDAELVISASTSGRVHKEFAQRADVLLLEGPLKPEMASLTLGSMNFPKQPSVNSPEMIQSLATAMRRAAIVPEWELFDLGMIDYAQYLIGRGILQPPYYANILLGSLGTLSATPYHLAMMVRALPEGTTWAAAGIGRFQFFMNSMAVTMDGHVRIGLEDNLHYDAEKKRLATNAGLIERIVGVADSIGRPIATAGETRRIMGLPAALSEQVVFPMRKAA